MMTHRWRRVCRPVLVSGSVARRWYTPPSPPPPTYHRLYAATSSDASATVSPKVPAATKKRAVKLPSVASITEDAARLELLALDAEINRHDTLYYEEDRPELTDAAYDKLVKRADALVGKFSHLRGLVKKLEGKVGAGRRSNKFQPFPHSRPMLSLDNAFSEDDLAKFVTRAVKDAGGPAAAGTEADADAGPVADAGAGEAAAAAAGGEPLAFVVEPKIDGLSLAVRYVNGRLMAAGTRGDGSTGEEVTARYVPLLALPSHAPSPCTHYAVSDVT